MLNQIFLIIIFLILYVVVYIYLKPFKYHTKYKNSTLLLKLSYLGYLLIAMILLCYNLFFTNKSLYNTDGSITGSYVYIVILLMLVGYIVPNIGILIRRKIKNRENYNNIFSMINISVAAFFLLILFMSEWALKYM